MSAPESIQRRYDALRAKPALSIEIPEWEGTYYFCERATVSQHDSYALLCHDNRVAGLAEFIAVMLRDEKGVPVFGPENKELLQLEDPLLIIRIAQQMQQQMPPMTSVEDAEKNSSTTPTGST